MANKKLVTKGSLAIIAAISLLGTYQPSATQAQTIPVPDTPLFETIEDAARYVGSIQDPDPQVQTHKRADAAMKIVEQRMKVLNDISGTFLQTIPIDVWNKFSQWGSILERSEALQQMRDWETHGRGDLSARGAWIIQGGNCDEHASVMAMILNKAGEKTTVFRRTEGNGHAFPVVGLPTDADPDLPWTWGDHFMVPDSWSDELHTNPNELWNNSEYFNSGKHFVYSVPGETTREALLHMLGKGDGFISQHPDAFNKLVSKIQSMPPHAKDQYLAPYTNIAPQAIKALGVRTPLWNASLDPHYSPPPRKTIGPANRPASIGYLSNALGPQPSSVPRSSQSLDDQPATPEKVTVLNTASALGSSHPPHIQRPVMQRTTPTYLSPPRTYSQSRPAPSDIPAPQADLDAPIPVNTQHGDDPAASEHVTRVPGAPTYSGPASKLLPEPNASNSLPVTNGLVDLTGTKWKAIVTYHRTEPTFNSSWNGPVEYFVDVTDGANGQIAGRVTRKTPYRWSPVKTEPFSGTLNGSVAHVQVTCDTANNGHLTYTAITLTFNSSYTQGSGSSRHAKLDPDAITVYRLAN